ncbi:Protein SRG1 [Linum perenne]
MIEIPVIATSTAKELEKLRSALNSFGCIMITNHGVESSLLDKVHLVFNKFLQLPCEEKLKYWNEGVQGYGSDPVVTDSLVHDWSLRLRLIICPEEMREMKYWPENPQEFREVLHQYSSKLQVLHDVMLKAMARSLKLEEGTFLQMIGEPVRMSARFNFYPPCPCPNQVIGLKPHSDGTVITFLLQDKEVEGLQILKEDQWFRVPIIPDALVLNIGEHLEIMSNGEFKSPIHRAVVNSERNRISLAVPSVPRDDTEIEPVEGLISEGQPRLYKKVKYSRSIHLHYYQNGKRIVDDARI